MTKESPGGQVDMQALGQRGSVTPGQELGSHSPLATPLPLTTPRSQPPSPATWPRALPSQGHVQSCRGGWGRRGALGALLGCPPLAPRSHSLARPQFPQSSRRWTGCTGLPAPALLPGCSPLWVEGQARLDLSAPRGADPVPAPPPWGGRASSRLWGMLALGGSDSRPSQHHLESAQVEGRGLGTGGAGQAAPVQAGRMLPPPGLVTAYSTAIAGARLGAGWHPMTSPASRQVPCHHKGCEQLPAVSPRVAGLGLALLSPWGPAPGPPRASPPLPWRPLQLLGSTAASPKMSTRTWGRRGDWGGHREGSLQPHGSSSLGSDACLIFC